MLAALEEREGINDKISWGGENKQRYSFEVNGTECFEAVYKDNKNQSANARVKTDDPVAVLKNVCRATFSRIKHKVTPHNVFLDHTEKKWRN